MNADDERLLEVLERGQRRGYLGTGELQAHIRHARAHGDAANPAPGQLWCDLGSGGGVPGLVIALDRLEVELVLLDRSQRRAEFLADAVRRLSIDGRVRIACGDAAELAHRPEHRHVYDGVVSRAFGAPATVAECSSGLVRPRGRLVVSEPPGNDRTRWPSESLAQLGMRFVHRTNATPAFAVLERFTTPDAAYPRAWKQIRKRPLF